ncbi:MAG: 2,3-bisphosphoglycerate-independent phosphoglycerate mutase [Chitinophagales bacterium]|jgi:2,3-bisphosphoglycerate-independent phosphoglycerate mutase|nr:2,3-bisphosphoglycerate-independent phosphoglycerate mutase [Chitinophagales bacterium]
MSSRVILTILDGWGIAKDTKRSAIDNAGDLFVHQLMKIYPASHLITYGEAVGLPEGQMGNSEVGHLTIGAGRTVYQNLYKINKWFESGEFAKSPSFERFMTQAKSGKKIHLLGLYSQGGVHSHLTHFQDLIRLLNAEGISEIYLHLFSDGRDTAPKVFASDIEDLNQFFAHHQAKIASVIGRYYAMDRDNRYERIAQAYHMLTSGVAKKTSKLVEEIRAQYQNEVTDEFLNPMITDDFIPIETDDIVLCVNFRTDRLRQLTKALSQEDFSEYQMKKLDLCYWTMTEYDKTFQGVEVLLDNDKISNSLGEVLSKFKKNQIRVAETEKYPHVTFFFSCGQEIPFEGEKRIMINSPKVATYDLKPEMSAIELTDALLDELKVNSSDFVLINYANADMVGHTGVFEAAVSAVKTVDASVKRLYDFAKENEYEMLIIADHGNSDIMINEDGTPHTAHTTNLVPCIYVGNQFSNLANGDLRDIAPTILQIMQLEKGSDMTGNPLLS